MTIHEARTGIGSEQSLWKGPDIKTAAAVVIPAHADRLVPIIIDRNSLPSLQRDEKVYLSMCSRVAQLGLDANAKTALEICLAAETVTNGSSCFTIEVSMINHGARAIAIKEDARVFRLYSYSKDQIVRGAELRELVDRADIKIEGSEGTGWEWDIDDEGNPIGVYVSIKPNSIMWIPPDSNAQPLVVDERVHDYRQVIDTLLQPAPQTGESILWIAETPKITLSTSVDAILAREVVIFGEGGLPVATELIQINSRLIDGGKTDWPVRLEILGQLSVGELLYVRFSFIKRSELPSRN